LASGTAHNKSILYLSPVAGVVLYNFFPDSLALSLTVYAVGGYLLSPDIDLENSKPSKNWLFLSPIWYPYRVLSGHRDHSFWATIRRGSFSHFPIIGTLSRMLYVFLMVFGIAILNHAVPELIILVKDNFFVVFVALEVSAVIHLAMDYTPGLNKL
jgi:uncharacterized metal-binding protein